MLFKKKVIINDYVHNEFSSLNAINSSQDVILCYTILAYKDKSLTSDAGHYLYDYLADKSFPEIISICEHFNQCTSLDWNIDWRNVNIHPFHNIFLDNRIYISLLILGSYHPNGYYRERCLTELTNYKETLPFILLRLNDWVDVIKDLAYKYSLERITHASSRELYTSLYIVDKIEKSQRRNSTHFHNIKKEILNNIVLQKDLNVINLIYSYEFKMRKPIYKYILPLNILTTHQLNECLLKEKNCFCQLLIIRHLLENHSLSDNQLLYYLKHKRSYIRKEALIYKYQLIQDYWIGLEDYLLDSCYSIRDYTRFILKNHTDFNILEYYKNSLENKNAFYGISECGSFHDVKDIIPYLESDKANAVLCSLNHLLKEKGKEIYWKYLFSDNIAVSKQAYLAIKDNKIKYGAKTIYNDYIHCDIEHIKRYLFKLIFNEDAWDRLPYLLILYSIEIEDRVIIINSIKNRNLYYSLSQDQANELKSILNNKEYQIPPDIIKSILFDLKFITK